MTEQEGEALAARLTRIWQVQLSPTAPVWNLWDVSFYFSGHVGKCLCLTFRVYDDGQRVELEPEEGKEVELLYRYGKITPCWTCSPREEPGDDVLKLFAAEWEETFRRNCWLSGCDVEASAHEKAEWMRGFTQEEIESWNLKL